MRKQGPADSIWKASASNASGGIIMKLERKESGYGSVLARATRRFTLRPLVHASDPSARDSPGASRRRREASSMGAGSR